MTNMPVVLFLWAVVGGLIGAAIGRRKNRAEGGFVLGMLLGPIGWLLVASGPSYAPKCPLCGGDAVEGLPRCKSCGGALTWDEATPSPANPPT